MTPNIDTSSVIDPLTMYRRKGGIFAGGFCSSPHPTDKYTWCRRRPDHPGDHAAYRFKISEPEYWPAEAAAAQ